MANNDTRPFAERVSQRFVEGVKRHAIDNYDTDGWDYLVECYDNAEIAEAIGDAKTLDEAIKRVQDEFGLVHKAEYRADIQAEVF